jgi:hypothetical protein
LKKFHVFQKKSCLLRMSDYFQQYLCIS